MEKPLTNHNCMPENTTKFTEACCKSIQNRLSSNLLPKNTNIQTHGSITLPSVLYGCGTWSLSLTKEHWLQVFENWVLREISETKGDEVTGTGEKSIMRSFMI
jgi:hypothetical protein